MENPPTEIVVDYGRLSRRLQVRLEPGVPSSSRLEKAAFEASNANHPLRCATSFLFAQRLNENRGYFVRRLLTSCTSVCLALSGNLKQSFAHLRELCGFHRSEPVSHMRMTINCDMGEGFGLYRLGDDAAMMPHIDLANVACGFHASDPTTMRETVRLAKKHDVKVGAHPSLPDLQGFGRRAMVISPAEVTDLVTYQVGALKAFLDAEGVALNHVKPHGALYGMAARDEKIAAAIADAVLPFGVPILGMACTAHETAYGDKGIEFIPEFYADLEYDGDGNLILSRVHDAVDPAKAAARVLRAMRDRVVATTTGRDIPVKANTVCVHSDTPSAVAIAAELDRVLRQSSAGP